METGLNLLAASLAIFLIGVSVYIALRSSNLILLGLGETGIRALSRIFGLFIMAIGVQLILNGVADWLSGLAIF